MSIRNRITQYLSSVLSSRIWFTTGQRIIGKSAAGAGYGSEIEIGTGLTLAGGTLSASGASDVGDLTTAGLTADNMLRVAVAGGLEERTPAQVLADIGVPALIRTAAQGSPNASTNIVITGITSPADSDPLTLSPNGTLGGKDSWRLTSGDKVWDAYFDDGSNEWVVAEGVSVSFSAYKASTADSPIGLTGWSPDIGTFTALTIAAGPSLVGTFVGQRCIVGTVNPVEYTWDGTAWYLSAPSGVIEDPNTPGGYLRLTVDSEGAMNPTAYTPADD
jgi:hypothetical protein